MDGLEVFIYVFVLAAVVGVVAAPFLLFRWLYRFIRRDPEQDRPDFAALAGWLIFGVIFGVIFVYVWGNALGIDLPPVFDPLPGGDR